MTERKTVGQRLAAYGKSERVEAKFLLLAMAPVVPLIISDGLGWQRNFIWFGWAGLAALWIVGIVTICVVSLLRAFRRSVREKRNGS